ncbi:hypothetical protein [Arthrobacter bambusae]|uniref:hypothetical protein n=1 Tax=Arthrobacter bambusae TaxID=1338426 RepID=UPI0027872CEA|nr:hypothetical protein [Arthrobacter bambusae]MDQ0238925.1 hypothetical protein [Arthrobacter bambusae]
MNDLLASLTRIERGLERLQRRVLLQRLRPGTPESPIRDVLLSLGLPNNAQVEMLFGWRNGTDTQPVITLDDIHVFPGFYLLSIEDAAVNYSTFRNDPRWTPGWLPLFSNGGGDFYAVVLAGERVGSVRHFRIDEREHPVEFESIGAMAATLAEAFDREIFFVDSNGYLEMDDLAFATLAAELNPRVPWWTDDV